MKKPLVSTAFFFSAAQYSRPLTPRRQKSFGHFRSNQGPDDLAIGDQSSSDEFSA
jgi:hypothetical protein